MGVIEYIKRYFRSYGHGVHSPLAYRIIKESLMFNRRRYGYRYYSDRYVELTCAGDRLAEKTAMFTIRLTSLLLPRCIWIPGERAEIIRRCVRKAYSDREVSGASECPKNAGLIVFFRNDNRLKSTLTIDPDLNCAVLVVPPLRNESVGGIRNLSPTLTIRSGWFSLFCRRKGMAPVEYDIL